MWFGSACRCTTCAPRRSWRSCARSAPSSRRTVTYSSTRPRARTARTGRDGCGAGTTRSPSGRPTRRTSGRRSPPTCTPPITPRQPRAGRRWHRKRGSPRRGKPSWPHQTSSGCTGCPPTTRPDNSPGGIPNAGIEHGGGLGHGERWTARLPASTLVPESPMLGPPKSRRLDQPIAVSLEDLVPTDHFYRHLETKLDLSFVRDWTRGLYAERGRPSIDPVVFFKLQLIMFFEGIRSERQLVATASLNLAHRWYLGYALDEPLPDHSSLTRIRQRLGIDIFQRFFEKVVDLCQEARLVWGSELYFDATKVEANAGIPSLVPRFYYEATTHVADLFADDATATSPAIPGDDLPPEITRLPSQVSTEGSPIIGDPP